MAYSKEIEKALTAAAEAGIIQRTCARQNIAYELKDDRSPVTEVDRRCETIIRDRLLSEFPMDGFLGEESGLCAGTSGRRWIVDPLDGTRPFLRGIPTHSVLIALEEAADVVLGIIHLPALDSTCWAVRGGGAFLNNTPIHVSRTASLGTAMGSGFGFVQKAETTEGRRLLHLMKSWDYSYGFMDAYSYVCVASGTLDLAVNLLDKPWDCASAACIVREAGGMFSDIYGAPTIHNGSILLSNGLVHEAALGFFCDSEPGRDKKVNI